MEELETEIAALEAEGAKDSDMRSRQKAVEKDLATIRERYDEELDLVQRSFDEFRDLHPRKIIEDEMLWRELKDRYGEYFDGGMGADALKQLINRIDLDEEEVKLKDQIDPSTGGRPLSAQRKQKAIKRLKIVTAFNRRDDHRKRGKHPRAAHRHHSLRRQSETGGHGRGAFAPGLWAGNPARAGPIGPARGRPLRDVRPQ